MNFDGWREVKLGEVGEVIGGGTPSTKKQNYYGGDVSWITPKDLSKHTERYIYRGERMLTEAGLAGSSAKLMPKDTVLFSSRAPIGYLAIAGKELCTNQGFKSILPKYGATDAMFLYYLMKFRKEDIESIASGTTFMEISGSALKNFLVVIPSINEQQAIAATLSYLDDKIELNNQINKALEEMAQAIFKSWFVDFEPFQDGEFEDSELGMIPKGWRVGALSDIAIITMGQSPRGSSYNEGCDGEIFYQGRAEFGIRFPSRRLYTTEPKRMASKGDVLVSVRAPVGDYNVALEPCCIGRGLAAIQSKNGHSSFILNIIFSLKKQLDIFNGEGTVFGSINKDSLNAMQIIIPSDEVLYSFEAIVKPIDIMIEKNYYEICNLQETRDTLLPKLMSGEIRVPIEEVQ